MCESDDESALVFGDGMLKKAGHVKQGDLLAAECWVSSNDDTGQPAGVRGPIVAGKPGNSGRAKGGQRIGDDREATVARTLGESDLWV